MQVCRGLRGATTVEKNDAEIMSGEVTSQIALFADRGQWPA